VNPGRRETAFVSLADIGTTLLDAVGLPPVKVMGKSLMPFLSGIVPGGWRDEIHTQCNGVELYYSQRSVMTKEYKYVFNGFDNDELYDLRNDPDEMYNKIHDSSLEAIQKEFCQRMWRFAYENQDEGLLNNYISVGLAPYGPACIFS
jgi:choline-sulfatase